MRAASGALIAHLAAKREFMIADLYTFTLVSGVILRLTNWGKDLTVGGNLFSASGAQIERGKIKVVRGLEVDELQITIDADLTDTITSNNVPILKALQQGYFDGATVLCERLYMPTEGDTSLGTVVLFGGRVSDADVSGSTGVMSVASDAELFHIKVPMNLYQPGCRHRVFDPGCTLVKASFGVNNAVTAGSNILKLVTTLVNPDGYFDLGSVTFTSGANSGSVRTIKSYASGIITFHLPLFFTPNNGDTFTAYPGCDNLKATCSTKFANLVNFAGHPNKPIAEAAL
jgi:uncharacterized phage protein (TIGR02218 family)